MMLFIIVVALKAIWKYHQVLFRLAGPLFITVVVLEES